MICCPERAPVKPYRIFPEMMWKVDPDIEAARKLPGWMEFHRQCGKVGLYFDIPSRSGNRGPFTVVAFTLKRNGVDGYNSYEIARASGRHLIQTMQQAHDQSGRATDETAALLDRMINPPAEIAADPLEGMFG